MSKYRLEFIPEYCHEAFNHSDSLVEEIGAVLAEVDYDTVVGAGISGTLVVQLVARALNKDFLIVRNGELESQHARSTVAGRLGRRWVFVDDLSASGRTLERVRVAVEAAAGTGFVTTYVGAVLYHHRVTFTAAGEAIHGS